MAPIHGTYVGSNSIDPMVAEISSKHHALERRVAAFDQKITAITWVQPSEKQASLMMVSRPTYVPTSGPWASVSVTNVPAPVMTPALSQKTGLQVLWEGPPRVTVPEPLKRDDNPDCKFWDQSSWKKWVEEGKEAGTFNLGVSGEGINSSWMEDKHGDRVPLRQQERIIDTARATWFTMRSYGIELGTQRNTDALVREFFYAKMESLFPELALCEYHWKCDQLWIENYSSYKKRGTKRKGSQDSNRTTGQKDRKL